VFSYGLTADPPFTPPGGYGPRPSSAWAYAAKIAPLSWASVGTLQAAKAAGGQVIVDGAWAYGAYGWPNNINGTLDALAAAIASDPSLKNAIAYVYLADEPDVADGPRPAPAKVLADYNAVVTKLPGVPTLIAFGDPWIDQGPVGFRASNYRGSCHVIGLVNYKWDSYSLMIQRVQSTLAVLAPTQVMASIMKIIPDWQSPNTGQPTNAGVRQMGLDAIAQNPAKVRGVGMWTNEQGIPQTLIDALPGYSAEWRALP
jgi:hypothetical protein